MRALIKDSVCYKYPNKIMIRPIGDYTVADSIHLIKTLASFNKALCGKLELSPNSDPIFDHRIDIVYSEDKCLDVFAMQTCEVYNLDKMVYPYYIYSKIKITSQPRVPQETKDKLIIIALFRNFGLKLNMNPDYFTINEDGGTILKPEYMEILSLFYEPIFYSGIKVSEIDKAIELLKQPEK